MKKMRNPISKCALILIAALLVSGCNKDEDISTEKVTEQNALEAKYNIPPITTDYFRVFAEDSKFIFSDLSICKSMTFTIITGEKLDKDKLKVELNNGIGCKFSIIEGEEELMPEIVFETYNKDADVEKLQEEYEEFAERLPKLYENTLVVDPVDFSSGEITELKVSYNGKDYISKIDVKHSSLDLALDEKDRFSCNTFARSDDNASYYIDGEFNVDNLEFTADSDVEINDLYFAANDSAKIDEIVVQENGTDYKWDKSEPIALSQSESLKLSIKFHDDTLKKFTSCNKYLVIKYTCDGKEYETYIDLSYRIRIDRYEMFAMEDDTVDYQKVYIENNKEQ